MNTSKSTNGAKLAGLLFFLSLNQVCYAQNWNPPVSTDVVVTPSGSLGVGVANPTKTLQVAGTVQFDSLGNNSGKNYLIYADSAGNLIKGPALEKPGDPGTCPPLQYWTSSLNEVNPSPFVNNLTMFVKD